MPDITFFRNGQKLKVDDFNGTVEISAGGVFGRQEIELLFFNVELGHAGNYTCQAQNKYNTRRRNLTLTVSCKFFLLHDPFHMLFDLHNLISHQREK